MGFWKNIATKLFGDSDDDDEVVEVEHLKRRSNMAEEDFGSTIIFNNGVPDYNVTLGQTGEGERVSMAAIQQAQRETDMINQRYRIGNGAARGVGVNSMAQQPPPRPINNQQQFAGSYQAPVYQQQGYYQQPVQQPMQQQMQQPMQQQIPPQGQPIPLTQDSNDPAILREPFSELVMTTDTCHVLVDLPGLTKSDVNIVLTPQNEVSITFTRRTFVDSLTNELKASAKKTKTKSKTKPKITSQVNIPDFLLGTHTVVYPIPRPVDTKKIGKSFENGQLHLTLGFLTPLEGTAINLD